jgi:hypothetical protein
VVTARKADEGTGEFPLSDFKIHRDSVDQSSPDDFELQNFAQMKSTSNAKFIGGILSALLLVNCAAIAATPAAGPLKIHPTNPRYFTDGTKSPDGSVRAVYLTGSHTWNSLIDMTREDASPKFDFDAYLDFLEKHHHNFIRLWAWDSTEWETKANGRLGKDFVHHVAPLPWARTGPGQALDGKPKFDLSRFDAAFFERLSTRTVAAQNRGIYVSVMLFEGWGLMHGNQGRASLDGWAWRSHPFHPTNNVNEIGANVSKDGVRATLHSRIDSRINDLQAAYIRQVVDTVSDLDNVLFEVINEGGQREWDWWVVDIIRQHELTKPKRHPIGITGHGAERLASMLASPADWISPGRIDGYAENPPAWDGKKVSLLDTDHIWGVGGNAAWAWKSFLRGHNPLFMDPDDGSVLGIPSESEWEPLRHALGVTRQVAELTNLAELQPRDELASTGYCLANPGKEYLVYQGKSGEAFTVQLEERAYVGAWFNPVKDSTPIGTFMQPTGGKQQFKAPFSGEALLHLKAR